ncbi:hypothetical protein T265_00736 [Opisthorchis viverrini]|uniref:Uncharacterized protein n=1 Tax=Opisthorchis viverrini TaxID=6198 RepID=A0A075AJI2_OPIVI|nr:hypothetical protein T265_00736 [Opisthorchis viverrini]KER33429.1 hypothetical protein T265_00736 [Opisthorchis viverrini]
MNMIAHVATNPHQASPIRHRSTGKITRWHKFVSFITSASIENQHVVYMEVCWTYKLDATPEAAGPRFFKQVSGKLYNINYISRQYRIKATAASVFLKLY